MMDPRMNLHNSLLLISGKVLAMKVMRLVALGAMPVYRISKIIKVNRADLVVML